LTELDIVIPVYNERENITLVLDALHRHVKTPCRIFICYDFDEDTTLEAIAEYPKDRLEIVLLKNPGAGPHDAVREGFSRTSAPFILTHMGDDDYTPPMIDSMVEKAKQGYDIVTGSRFMKGGRMVGARWDKKFLTWFASFTLYHFARLPVHDATHGVRVFSRRVFDTIEIESRVGFSYSFEFMVKAHRLGWKIWEFPVEWHERKAGTSRFAVLRWLVPYLRWYFFAFATTYLRQRPEKVRAKIKET
jgi:glycosyltransferase involved in cell wall biosynthesis